MDSLEERVQALERFVEAKEEQRANHPLKFLAWESTLRCNLDCLHCGSDCLKDNAAGGDEISAVEMKGILKDIAEVYDPDQITVPLIGGEPLVRRRDILDVGSYAASLGYHWGIVTNALLLNQDTIKELKAAGLQAISVSVDGIEADHDAQRRRPGLHKIVVLALQGLLEDPFYRKFDVICCVTKINIERLEGFLEDLLRLGVPAVRFAPVFCQGRALKNPEILLDDVDYRRLLNFIAEKRRAHTEIKLNLAEEGYLGPEWECVVRDRFHYCASGILVATILHDGKVTGCASVSRDFIEGNIREAPFVEIWEKGFHKYRDGRREAFPTKCRDCEDWVLCEGGGFHLLNQEGPGSHRCLYNSVKNGG
jgi:radical SAM protein with 4Fe4S-binding SPASM domain